MEEEAAAAGGGEEREDHLTQAQPLAEEPWGAQSDLTLEELKERLASYRPGRLSGTHRVEASNVLLVGPVGSGKSSFFNTVNSAFQGHVTSRACAGSMERSLTTKYQRYKVYDPDEGLSLKFRLCDTVGLEDSHGLSEPDFSAILRGRVLDNFRSKKSRPGHGTREKEEESPMDDRIHCLVIVLDSCSLDAISETIRQKISDIQEKANEMDIPQAVLLTKVDQLCGARGGEDLVSLEFRSSAVEGAVSRAAQMLGLPRAHVLPVQNYESEARLVPELDRLALLALSHLLHLADEFLHRASPEVPRSFSKDVIEKIRSGAFHTAIPVKEHILQPGVSIFEDGFWLLWGILFVVAVVLGIVAICV